jgi:hypothetical protein
MSHRFPVHLMSRCLNPSYAVFPGSKAQQAKHISLRNIILNKHGGQRLSAEQLEAIPLSKNSNKQGPKERISFLRYGLVDCNDPWRPL